MKNPVVEEIHNMLSDYNETPGKVFYYSEEEVRALCKEAFTIGLPKETFNLWWDNVKKK